jgi:hypothetical protein
MFTLWLQIDLHSGDIDTDGTLSVALRVCTAIVQSLGLDLSTTYHTLNDALEFSRTQDLKTTSLAPLLRQAPCIPDKGD